MLRFKVVATMVLRILKYLIFYSSHLFAYNMSDSLGNTTFTQSTLQVNLTYSSLSTTTDTLTHLSSNIASYSLSTVAQNVTTWNSSVGSSLNNLKESLRYLEVKLTEKSPVVFCKFQPNGFDCDESGIFTPKFYYDLKMEACKTFYFGQCKTDQNRFDALPDCLEACLEEGKLELSGEFSAKVYCKLQPDFGKCNEYHPMWYYDVSSRECRGFSYSGCGGNLNRFATHQLCVSLCSNLYK